MTKSIEIFKAGTHTDMTGRALTFTVGDLDRIAASYGAGRPEAPLVVGHPAHDAPAYGWVKALRVDGDRLIADVGDVAPAFGEAVREGRYKHVSASFFLPDAASNPTPGGYALRHVGFLGGMPPAIPSLKPVSFADDGSGVVSLTIDFATPAPAPAAVPAGDAAAFAAQATALAAREAALAAREREVAMRDVTAFVAAQVQAGRVLPVHQDGLVAFMASLEGATVDFGASGTMTPGDWFRGWLSSPPAHVSFVEVVKNGVPPASADGTFVVPAGYDVPADALTLHNKAVAYAAAHGVDFLIAAAAVS